MSMQDFKSSNLLRFDNPINYRVAIGIVGIDPWEGSTEPDFFIEKREPLGFKLDLGKIHPLFEGMFIFLSGRDTDRNIQWTVNNDRLTEAERPEGKSVLGYRIKTVSGTLMSRVDDIVPAVDSSNTPGEDRLYRTSLNFTGDSNNVVIEFYLLGEITATATVTILSAAARCGVAVPSFSFDVNINYNHYRENGCGERSFIVNEPVRFNAGVSNIRSLGRPTETKYSWKFSWRNESGGWDELPPVGPSTNNWTDFTPNREGILRVTAIADVTTDSARPMENGLSSMSFQILVQSMDMFLLSSAICNLRRNATGLNAILVKGFGESKTIGGIRFIDPLWDPTPDYFRAAKAASKPYTLQQLQQIRRNMERTAKYTTEIINKTSKLIEVKQKEDAALLKKQLKQASATLEQKTKAKQPKPVM